MENFEKISRHRAREVLEHRPTELLFSVNGFVLSSLKVSSERSEQSQSISIDEKVSFVEVFSSQGVRMLFLDVEAPPAGAVVQSARVKLSDGRKLDLSLSFSDSWPSLHAVYWDPLMREGCSAPDADSEQGALEKGAERSWPENLRPAEFLPVAGTLLRSLFLGIRLRPATVTAIIGGILVTALLLSRLPMPKASAAELLRKAGASEDAIAARTDQVLRRTIDFEERSAPEGKVIARSKIEVWRSAEKGITARRMFDHKNNLVAGEWARADGSRMIYQQGGRLQVASDQQSGPGLTPDKIWLIDPSAKEFAGLVGRVEATRVEEKGSDYIISYEGQAPGVATGAPGVAPADGKVGLSNSSLPGVSLVTARLVMSKANLHTIEQRLLLSVDTNDPHSPMQPRQLKEYRFTEASFESRAPNAVAPAVFEPDPILLAGSKAEAGGKRVTPDQPSPVVAAPPLVASTKLEVDVLDKLNRVNAFLGEQLILTRTPEGVLLLGGIVETDKRKSEILESLGSLARDPALKVEVLTVAEAQGRQARTSPGKIIVEEVQVRGKTIPVETDLRSYLSAKGYPAERIEQQVGELSNQIFEHSARARSHALAMKQIAERFSRSDLEAMDEAVRANWRSMIGGHAEGLQRELRSLRADLGRIFPASAAEAAVQTEVASDEDLVRSAKHIFELASTNDAALRMSFSLSTDKSVEAPVKTAGFWRSFSSAEGLAAKIAHYQP
jgi:hypothetical protein